MTTSRPPGRSTLRLCSRAIFSASISPLTSMRSAWKSLVRNFAPSRFGVQGCTAATSCAVVAIGSAARARTRHPATFHGVSTSPQSPTTRVSSSTV